MDNKKILIIDDEKMARDRLHRFLTETTGVFDIKQASNGVEALEMIATFKPHIIFLDIQMPGLSGFEVLQQIEIRDFQIIFQTAYDEYAVKAFEESACDYLLKPFSKERFDKALSKALSAQNQIHSLQQLDSNLQQQNLYLEKIAYKQGARLKILPVQEIAYVVSQNHYTCAYDKSGTEYIVDFSIAHLEDHLNPDIFVRCHRNSIVAIEQIKSVGGTDDSTVELKNGVSLPLSRSNRNAVLKTLSR